MSEGFFFTFFYQPIYNLLVWLIDILPGNSVGMALILTTILIKLFLYPLTKKAILSQVKMQEIQPKIEAAKKKHKGDREAEARAQMEIYREAKLNPFAGLFSILIQLPVIFVLFFIFSRSGLPEIRDILYSFVSKPESASMFFLGFFLLSSKSWILAVLAGVTQFIQAQIATPTPPVSVNKEKEVSFQKDFMKSMNFQVKYILPVIIIFVAHSLSAAVALYFVVSNVFSILQEMTLRRHRVPLRV